VPREQSHFILFLALDFDSSIEAQDGYVEIVDRFGEQVWRSPLIRLMPGDELPLFLTRERVPYGDYRIRVYPESGTPLLAEQKVRIEVAE